MVLQIVSAKAGVFHIMNVGRFMNINFNCYESFYRVFTHLCYDWCDHCYNNPGIAAEQLTDEECLANIHNWKLPLKANLNN